MHNIPILDPHELSAGKLAALIDRKTGRDLFDAYHLLTKTNLDMSKLRLALIVYSGISRKADLRQLTSLSSISIASSEVFPSFFTRIVSFLAFSVCVSSKVGQPLTAVINTRKGMRKNQVRGVVANCNTPRTILLIPSNNPANNATRLDAAELIKIEKLRSNIPE